MFWLRLLRLIPGGVMRWLVKRYGAALIRRAMRTPYFDLPGYMRRWWLFKDVRFLGHTWSARIHCTLRSDLDRHLHDHPYDNASVLLDGGYWEVVSMSPETDPGGFDGRMRILRMPGDVVVRDARAAHRLELFGEVWSLFIIRKENKRDWGFWTEDGWVYWKRYVDPETLSPEELAELDHAEPVALALR